MKADTGSAIEILRSKGCRRGFDGIGDCELLALVMGKLVNASSVAVAQEILEAYGGLEEISGADVGELLDFRGIGQAGALRIKASLELGRRCVVAMRQRRITRIGCPEDAARLMIPEMKGLDREHFKAVLLDTKNSILRIVTVAIGSLNAALVHPREIFKAAVSASAAGMIVVHNHPTGNPEPSREDIDLTERFARCGDLMGIDLVDHIIVGGESYVSMRERGLVKA